MPQQQPADDWQDIEDDWQDIQEPAPKSKYQDFWDSTSSYIPQSAKSGWETINVPLINKVKMNNTQIFDPKEAANYYDKPSLEEPWRIPFTGGATWKGLGAGMLEGAGNVVGGLTSPLNLATMGAFKGASSLAETAPMAARGMQMVGRGLSAPVAAQGASEMIRPDASMTERGMGLAELAGGVAGMAQPLPVKPKSKTFGGKKFTISDDAFQPAGAPIEQLPVKQPGTNIPIVQKTSGPADYAMDNAYTKARGGEVSPQMAELAKEPNPNEFNPTTLQGLEPASKPELEFLNPKTGETRPASQAEPGDIPLPEAQPTATPTRRAGKRMGTPDIGPTPEALPAQAPKNVSDWINDLVKGESGEANPDAITNMFRGEEPPVEQTDTSSPIRRPRVNSTQLSRENRTFIESLPREALQEWVDGNTNNSNYTDFPTGRDMLDYARDILDTPGQTFQSGRPHPTTRDDLHNLATHELQEFVGSNTNDRLVPYAEGILRERGGRGTRLDIGDMPDESTTMPWEHPEYQRRYPTSEGKAGKTLDELEATKKKPALERLGKLVGEDRAAKLQSGETKIEFSRKAERVRGKKISASHTRNWNEWGDSQIFQEEPNPNKTGLHQEEASSVPGMFPNALKLVYRDAEGNPIGVLQTDLDGKGISTLAVDSKLGLRRGKVAFEMLKQAFDRGITEPSGATSDFTNNLIERVKRLVQSDKGEFDMDALHAKVTKILDELGKSSIGKAVGNFLKDESGGGTVPDRLQALFEKQQKGTLTPEELAEAKQLAKASMAEPKQSPKEYIEGKSQVDTGPLVPENVRPPQEVIESLNKRLKKATENPNPDTAPEDISKLVKDAEEVIKIADENHRPGIVRQVLNANKALLTSWDLSAPGRQGKAFIFNKSWWTSLDDMAKAWGSEEAAHQVNQSILDHPSGYFKKPVSETGKVGKSFAEKMGLDLAAHEEMFTGVVERMGAKIPLVQKSSRAHTAFLNKLRSDQFVSMMETSKETGVNPESNPMIAKSYAKFINDATGRGSLNIGKWKLERNVNTLNDVFFAPKNMSGQIRTWNNVLNPVKYYNYDPVLRKQALTSLFAVAGMGLGVGEVAKLAGAKVSNDPTNPDFRKVKVGDTRIDLFGGYQQFPVAAMKLITGQSTSSTSGKTTDLTGTRYGQQTRASTAERFFTNRLSPAASFIYAWMNNREFDGKPFEAKRALFERVFPIAAKDIVELAQEDPRLALILGPATLMGFINTQTYTGR